MQNSFIPSTNSKGSAIIISLIISVVAMLIASFIILASKNLIASSDLLFDKLKAKFGAESLLEKIKFYVSTGEFKKFYIENPVVKTLPKNVFLDGRKQKVDKNAIIVIKDAGSMLNIWAINPKILYNLVTILRENKQKASIIEDSLMDWIDRDNLVRLNGAEREYYIGRGYRYPPRNSPNLQSIFELSLIRGMDSKTFSLLKNYLVLSPKWLINLNTVDEKMLEAILGISPSLAKSLIKIREEKGGLTLDDIEKTTGITLDPSYYETFPTFTLDIKLTFRFNKAVERKGCVISFYPDNSSPYRVLRWEN